MAHSPKPNARCDCEVRHDESRGLIGACHCRILRDGSHDPRACKCGPPGEMGVDGIRDGPDAQPIPVVMDSTL